MEDQNVQHSLTFFVWLGCFALAGENEKELDDNLGKPLRTITDSKSSNDEWNKAIHKLDKPPEPPKIWTDIANDSKYPLERRREALFKLFERHVPPRTKLSALGELLAGAKWLENRDMTFEFAPSGLIPLNET